MGFTVLFAKFHEILAFGNDLLPITDFDKFDLSILLVVEILQQEILINSVRYGPSEAV